jgi:hypothetical protein
MFRLITRPTFLVWLVLSGLGLRLLLGAVSVGTNDISLWYRYSAAIEANGLAALYAKEPLFNHPPLAGYLGRYSFTLARMLGLPFPYVFKVPTILADVLTAYLVWVVSKRRLGLGSAHRALAMYALSVCSILISAYHGNTDSLCCALAFLSLFLVEEKKRHFSGGLALAAAINVKLIPAFIFPAMVMGYRSKKDCLVFTAGTSLGALPFVAMIIVAGHSFTKNVFQYNSIYELWGIQAFLYASEQLSMAMTSSTTNLVGDVSYFYSVLGRYVVAISIATLCLYVRVKTAGDRYEMCAMSIALFLLLAPGFGVQYAVYPVAFIFAVSLWWGAVYATVAGAFIVILYCHFVVSYLPLASWHVLPYPPRYALPATMTWGVLVAFLIARLRAVSADSFAKTSMTFGAVDSVRPGL